MICSAFHCPPSVALLQDAELVRHVLETQAMSRAHALAKQKDGLELVKESGLMESWYALHEARQERRRNA